MQQNYYSQVQKGNHFRVSSRTANPSVVLSFSNLPNETAMLVLGVGAGSPGESCEGDLVVEFNANAIPTIDDLHKYLTGPQAGVRATLTIIRHNEKLSAEITPEEAEPKSQRN